MKLLFFVLSLTLLLSGCGSSSSSSDKKTQSLSLNNVKTNSTVTLKLNDTDSIKSYSWWSQNGGILGHTSSIRWTAPSKSGRYTVTVDTVDDKNNRKTSSIVINVISDLEATSKPTITLNGNSSLEIKVGSSYKELGATAKDNDDGDISDKIVIDGEVDTSTVNIYKITYSVVDSDGNTATQIRYVTVIEDTYEDPKSFTKIKQIIESSKIGTKATYIMVGDSTRAINTNTNAQRLFDSVKSDLSLYNVNSILRARGSHMLEEFINNTNTPRVSEVISDIPGRGETSIVDMSLGVNDFFYLNEHLSGTYAQKKVEIRSTVKARLKQALNLILKAKPKTTIYLTIPNPMYSWKDATDIMKSIYIEVSNEMSLPLVNYVDPLMNGFEENRYDNWYRMLDTGKLDGIHFSDYGLDQVSNYILGEILP